MNSYRDQRGQAAVLTVLCITVLLGMAALVLDLGSWFRAQRDLQADADAAALAGAHALPESPGDASALAAQYAGKNGAPSPIVSFASKYAANDTIKVRVERPAPGFFAKVFGIDSVDVAGTASARAAKPSSARWVAPVVVNVRHPMLLCKPLPCFGQDTMIQLAHLHKPGSGDAAGAFGLLNLKGRDKGNAGAEEVGEWMFRGYSGYMPLGFYNSVPSTMFNSGHFQNALRERVGDEVLFPIYRPPVKKSGSNAEYDIVGWVGFLIRDSKVKGDDGEIYGSFVRVIWEGIQSESSGDPDFGVRTISLVE